LARVLKVQDTLEPGMENFKEACTIFVTAWSSSSKELLEKSPINFRYTLSPLRQTEILGLPMAHLRFT
jgi:DNA gyrase inhibitor GyrI